MPFGFGIGEMVLVSLVVLLLTGGSRLPRIAAKLVEAFGQLRRTMSDVGAQLRAETEAQVRASAARLIGNEPQHYGAAVRTVLARAGTEAVRLQHPSVGTEHLLLALTLEPDRATEGVLLAFGVRLEQVAWRLKESLLLGHAPVVADVPYNGGAKRAIRAALEEAEALRHRRVDPVHVLLALAGGGDPAGETLRSLGVELERARVETARALG
jgi:Sec-independent protein translocase protein TatA